MAAQGKCPDCKAAFTFPARRGFPACPHCGTTLAQTTHEYSKGPWFAIGPAKDDRPAAPAAAALDSATHIPFYRFTLAVQDAGRAQAEIARATRQLAWLEDHATRRILADYERNNLDGYRELLAVTRIKLADAQGRAARYAAALEKAQQPAARNGR